MVTLFSKYLSAVSKKLQHFKRFLAKKKIGTRDNKTRPFIQSKIGFEKSFD